METGEYAPGDRLPSNKALAERYAVAAETVRAALDELRAEGLIATQSTRGTYVVNKPGESVEETVRRLASGLEDALHRLDKVEERLSAAERVLREDGQ